MQIGAGYVASEFRGNNLLFLLTKEIIARQLHSSRNLTHCYAQIFSCNVPSIKTFEKANFNLIAIKESSSESILNYLPSNKKLLMAKDLLIN